MKKTKLNYVQLLFLITAFLTIQWTSTHVHFSENHNHDGNIHKHQIETHTHQYLSLNDSSIQVSHINIIELDTKDYIQNRKIEKTESLDIAIQTFNLQAVIPLVKLDVPLFINKRQGYSLYSSSNPRAPPLNS
jgi:hypothetical protein